jgi:hypothetical protein
MGRSRAPERSRSAKRSPTSRAGALGRPFPRSGRARQALPARRRRSRLKPASDTEELTATPALPARRSRGRCRRRRRRAVSGSGPGRLVNPPPVLRNVPGAEGFDQRVDGDHVVADDGRMAVLRTTGVKIAAVVLEVVFGILEIAIGASTTSTVIGAIVIIAALTFGIRKIAMPYFANRSARNA